MTREEMMTLKEVADIISSIRERMARVETSQEHMTRALEQLSTDVRVNTVATVQQNATQAAGNIVEADKHKAIVEAFMRDGRVRGWVFGAWAAFTGMAAVTIAVLQWALA